MSEEQVEREEMEVDFLVIGGGAAGLSAAIRYAQCVNQHNTDIESGKKTGEPLDDPMIVVLEKGAEIGAHSFSGAVMKPEALRELFPDYKAMDCPLESPVVYDELRYLTKSMAIKAPVTPPPFHNEGNYVVTLSKFNRWLGEQAEELGINIFPGFAAVEALYDGDKIIGVRTGDRGLDKDGNRKANFEPGMLLYSKVTVFADGTRSPLFKRVSEKLDLRKDSNEEVFEEGVKEVIQMPEGSVEPGHVIHTMGYPLEQGVGGSFIYTCPGDRILLGIVCFLDSKDPLLDPHRELQKLKAHPWIAKMIKGGKVIAYGGKTLPAGGWYSMPQLYGEGWMVAGDSASMVDVQKLKGIHLAMDAGMRAGETAYDALVAGDYSSNTLKMYKERIDNGVVKKDLYRVRNFHQTIADGIFVSMPMVALQEVTGGRGLIERMTIEKDHLQTESALDVWGPEPFEQPQNQLPKADNELFFDKLSSVYMTGTMHDEDSPNHLQLIDGNICRDTCYPKYKSPCNHFCPANVYEMLPNDSGKKDLQINYTNCIHCQTCDIKCPYDNIDWTLPEGGGGPQYSEV